MIYQQHRERAALLSPAEQDALLRSLALDERFCGVVAWMERNREAFVAAGSTQVLASDHGRLAHAQGSVHAINTLVAQLAHLLNPPAPPPGMQQPVED